MRICYIDESGDLGALPSATSSIQPVFTIIGLAVDQNRLKGLTADLLFLKRHFFKGLMPKSRHVLGDILVEVKGAEVRKSVRNGNRNERRAALHFLGCVLKLLEGHEARIFGRLWTKEIGKSINTLSIYTYSVQAICANFQRLLEDDDDCGIVIADSRRKSLNVGVSHSIFTQKYRYLGDMYGRILEMPTFGHSENHAGLQIVDWLASGMIFPMATFGYCSGMVSSVHVHPNYQSIRDHCGSRLRALQYRYNDGGVWKGGIVTSDMLTKQPGGILFGS